LVSHVFLRSFTRADDVRLDRDAHGEATTQSSPIEQSIDESSSPDRPTDRPRDATNDRGARRDPRARESTTKNTIDRIRARASTTARRVVVVVVCARVARDERDGPVVDAIARVRVNIR